MLEDGYPDCKNDETGIFKDVFFEDIKEVTMSLEGLTCLTTIQTIKEAIKKKKKVQPLDQVDYFLFVNG